MTKMDDLVENKWIATNNLVTKQCSLRWGYYKPLTEEKDDKRLTKYHY